MFCKPPIISGFCLFTNSCALAQITSALKRSCYYKMKSSGCFPIFTFPCHSVSILLRKVKESLRAWKILSHYPIQEVSLLFSLLFFSLFYVTGRKGSMSTCSVYTRCDQECRTESKSSSDHVYLQSYFSVTSFMQIRPQCHNKLRQSKSQTWLHCTDGYNYFKFSQSPWSFPTALTSLRSCGSTMRDFTAQQRLKYQAGPWTLKSPTLSCEMGTSPDITVSCEWWTLFSWDMKNLLQHLQWFGSGPAPQQGGDGYLPASRLGKGKGSESTACLFPHVGAERSQNNTTQVLQKESKTGDGWQSRAKLMYTCRTQWRNAVIST